LLLQRLNGRMAMLGFAGIALAELKTQVPAGEQLAGDVFGVLLLSLTFTLASIFPKFSTGRPLRVSAIVTFSSRPFSMSAVVTLGVWKRHFWLSEVLSLGWLHAGRLTSTSAPARVS
jgi:hypothetical protein